MIRKPVTLGLVLLIGLLAASCGTFFLPADWSPQPAQLRLAAAPMLPPRPPMPPGASRSGRSPAAAAVATTPAPTAPPLLVPPPVPTVSVEEFWQRMRALYGLPVLRQVAILPAGERGDPFFGINDALVADDGVAPFFQGIGAAIDRVEVRWDRIEPAPGVYRFDQLDRTFAQARQWHLAPELVVDGTPGWAAAASAAGSGVPIGLAAPPFTADGSPNPANPWAAFLAQLASRYRGQVAAWEIWNEPNLPQYWRGSPADYGQLLATARTVLGQADPGTPVLTAGMVEDNGAFLSATLQALCPQRGCPRSPFDGVAWHVYNDPQDILRVATRTRAMLAAYHLSASIWITEANVPVADPQSPADAVTESGAVSLQQQAAFVLQTYSLARVAAVHTVCIYRASDVDEDGHYWGLLRSDLSARPAALAYRTAGEWLSDTSDGELSQPAAGITNVRLRRPGQQIDVLWSDVPRPTLVRLPSSAHQAQLVQLTGASQTIAATDGAFTITLPAAPPHPPGMPVLASPVILVAPD